MLNDVQQAWLSILLGLAILWWLRRGPAALRGTTLLPAWCWAVLAVVAVTTVEFVLGLRRAQTSPLASAVRFAAAVLTFCPCMALLGAKRPQNGPWQFVVVTLWGILALPAAEVWLRGRGESLELHAVRSWFLVILILVGLVNHLPTRFGFAAVCLAAAQTVLFWTHLPFLASLNVHPPPVVGLMLLLMAVTTLGRASAVSRPIPDPSGELSHEAIELGAWSEVWRTFRDWFGTVWSVRVMERINASAAMYRWPVALGWEGFVRQREAKGRDAASAGRVDLPPDPVDITAGSEKTSLAPEQIAAVEQSLRTLLRRFVSHEWIDRRLQAHSTGAATAQ